MHKKIKIKYAGICFFIIATALLIIGMYKAANHFLPIIIKQGDDFFTILSGSDYKIPFLPDSNEQNSKKPLSDKLFSPYAILVRLKDRKTVFETKSQDIIYPASLTKIMTAIVAIENIPDIHDTIVLPSSIFSDLYSANASLAGFLPEEEAAAIDILYGALLPSGAECCIGLARHIAGSEQEFVKMMNKKAKDLGMDKTHFENTTGLYEDNHYTTVKDISILLEYALENETFRRIFTSERYTTCSTNLHPNGITFYSTMFVKIVKSEFSGGKILGGKTGYAGDKTGLCLASLAEKDGSEYILITAGADGNSSTDQYHIIDAFTVYDKYLENK